MRLKAPCNHSLNQQNRRLYEEALSQTYFFEIDGENMFRKCVHQVLMETLDAIGQERGFKLTDTEWQIKDMAA